MMTREKYLATKNSTENTTFPQKTAEISFFIIATRLYSSYSACHVMRDHSSL